MTKSTLLRGFAIVTIMVSVASVAAMADNFNFIFCNDPAGYGNVAGCITGQVQGIPHTGTSAASAIWITSYPVGLSSYTTPFDVLAWSGYTINEDSFTSVNGVITAAAFSLIGANGTSNDQLYLNSQCQCVQFGLMLGTNFADFGTDDTLYVWNDDGLAPTGVVFTNASGVPEPGTLALLGSGIVGLAGLARRKMLM
jgi:hypothetical protein